MKSIILTVIFALSLSSMAIASAPSVGDFSTTYNPVTNNQSALDTLKNEFSATVAEFLTKMRSTSLFSLPKTTLPDLSGDSVISFTSFQQDFSFDFSTWPPAVFAILRSIFMSIALFSCIKIIGKGSTV